MIVYRHHPTPNGNYAIGITIDTPTHLQSFNPGNSLGSAGVLTSPEHCTSIEYDYYGATEYPAVAANWSQYAEAVLLYTTITVTAYYDDGRTATASRTIQVIAA